MTLFRTRTSPTDAVNTVKDQSAFPVFHVPFDFQASFATTPVCASPVINVMDSAINVLFMNITNLPKDSDSGRTFMDYLLPMYNASHEGSPLRLSAEAVALCAIAKRPGKLQYVQMACWVYGKAMRAVALAMQDPQRAQLDETLQAVLMLALYEVGPPYAFSCPRPPADYNRAVSYSPWRHAFCVVSPCGWHSSANTSTRPRTDEEPSGPGAFSRCKNTDSKSHGQSHSPQRRWLIMMCSSPTPFDKAKALPIRIGLT